MTTGRLKVEGWGLHVVSAVGTVLFDLLLVCIIVVVGKLQSAASGPSSAKGVEEPQERKIEFVVARLVKLGTPPKDPSGLPRRKVPALATGPKDKTPISSELNPPEPPKQDKEKAPSFAVEDPKLRRIFDTARAFAEITDQPQVEGLPEGVPEGEVTDPSLAKAGDLYATKLYRIFKEMWVVPSLVPEKEREKLKAKVKLTIGADLKIHDYTFVKKSGNAQFDASVIEVFKKFMADGKRLPEPPDEVAEKLVRGGLIIKFHGKDYEK